MYILMNDLYQQLNNFSEILVYGAGNYAKMIYPFLKKAGLKAKIASFIVTDIQEDDNMDIDGIQIKPVKEIASFDTDKCVVLIAVSNKYAKSITRTLQQYNFTHILELEDFFYVESDLRTITTEQFIERIFEQHLWDNGNILIDCQQKETEVREKLVQREQEDVDKNTIVIISSYLLPRTVKIINALVRQGYQIILLEYDNYNMLAREELVSTDLELFWCQNILEVFYKALQYKPLAYYYDPMWGDRVCPEIMIRHKKVFGKIVIALYDVLNDGYVRVTEERRAAERYSLENADGIVWRWYSKEFLEEKKGFVFKGSSIQFLDYCSGYKFEDRKPTDDKLRLCLILGNTYGLLDETMYVNGGNYVEYARIDTILKFLGERDDCIFHAFMGDSSEEDRIKFAALEKKYSNFKVFYGTRHNELMKTISKYDYGCFFYTDGEDIPELETVDNFFYGSTHNNAMSNKYFDYLDAGLPIIATRPRKLCDYLDRFGVIVKMNIFDLDIEHLKHNKFLYKKNVESAKKELLIDNQIQRLIYFLEAL